MAAFFSPTLVGMREAYDIGAVAAFSSFGLEKGAASVNQLQQGYRRLGVMRTKRVPTAGMEGNINAPLALGATRGPATMASKSQMAQIPGTSMLPPETRAGFEALGGTIMMPAGGMVGFMKRQSRDPMNQMMAGAGMGHPALPATGAGAKAVNVLTGIHEGFERRVPANRVAPVASHMNLADVIVPEHNALTRLTGPGSDEARTYFQALRKGQGYEANTLNDAMTHLYGDRAAMTFGQGAKIPKAMRRNLGEHMKRPDVQDALHDKQMVRSGVDPEMMTQIQKMRSDARSGETPAFDYDETEMRRMFLEASDE